MMYKSYKFQNTNKSQLSIMKRITFLIFVTLLLSGCSQLGNTPNQAIVKQSVEPSLVVVCSKYGSPNRSGDDHRVEYGYCYTLGVFTDTGFVVSASALNDNDLSRHGLSQEAYLCGLSYRRIDDSLYQSLPPCAAIVTSELLHVTPEPVNNGPSLTEYTDTVFDNSLLLWTFVSDTLGKAGSLYTMVTELSVELDDTDLTQRVVAPTLDDAKKPYKAIGAVWVVPCNQAGKIQFRVAGMVVRDREGWVLAPLCLDVI